MSQDKSSKIPQGAPMNDVELDEILNHLESYSKESVLGYVHTNSVDHTAAKAAIQALFNQEKANLQAALEAELPKYVSNEMEKMVVMGWNNAVNAMHEAIAAVFNKGDKS